MFGIRELDNLKLFLSFCIRFALSFFGEKKPLKIQVHFLSCDNQVKDQIEFRGKFYTFCNILSLANRCVAATDTTKCIRIMYLKEAIIRSFDVLFKSRI